MKPNFVLPELGKNSHIRYFSCPYSNYFGRVIFQRIFIAMDRETSQTTNFIIHHSRIYLWSITFW